MAGQLLCQTTLISNIPGIAAQQQNLAQSCPRRIETTLAAAGDRHGGTFGNKLTRSFQTNTAGAAGDQRIFTFKS
ncbi:hypothetical protein D3C81_1284020 [compost metagenome]